MSKPKSEFKDWCEKPTVCDTVGNGWGVRINGCDVFDSINEYGVKRFRSFDIVRGLKTEAEAKEFLKKWLSDQLQELEK